MSEGVGFVNTALLEEEHDQPLALRRTSGVLDSQARQYNPRARVSPRRVVKTGRRPPVGGVLTARSGAVGQLDMKPVRASWMRLSGVRRQDACARRLQFPTGGEGQARTKLGCLVMSSPGPVSGSEHGAIRRSQQRSITKDGHARVAGGHAVTRAGLLAASELAQPPSAGARQRISPSRSRSTRAEHFAGRGDAADVATPPLGDAAVVGLDHVAAVVAADRLHRGPADHLRSLLRYRASAHLGVGLAVARGDGEDHVRPRTSETGPGRR